MIIRRDNLTSHETLVIVLSTVLGTIGVVAITLAAFWLIRSRRRHRLFNRGLTPIGDDEIATWKVSSRPQHEKEMEMEMETDRYTTNSHRHHHHASKGSTSSGRIQYQKPGGGGGDSSRPSADAAAAPTPRSFIQNGFSLDLPRAPEPAAFARAPNARSGLTDETVPGDDPFVPPLKRQPSRLQKRPGRANSSRSSSSVARASRSQSQSQSHPEQQQQQWHVSISSEAGHMKKKQQQNKAESSRGGGGGVGGGRGHSRIYSSSSIPPKMSSDEKEELLAGLSAPPTHRRHDVIGQALG